VLLLDANDQIEWCNAVAADHFGLDPQRDRRSASPTSCARRPSSPTCRRGVGRAGADDRPRGSARCRCCCAPYGDGQKLVLTQDITERERADAMRRDFVANVSHEIRTPLTVLAGFVETMASLPLDRGRAPARAGPDAQQTDRMQALVADLLTLAQLEGSPRPPTDRWHDVARAAAAVHRPMAARCRRGGMRSRSSLQADAELAGSRTELLSAVGNLVNNAVRYTPEGGRIDVRLALRDGGRRRDRGADTGIGIAREHMPRLTERFYRVDGSRSRDTGGTGLGLAIVKHVVQRHGGELLIDSEPGKGSRFRLLPPAVRVRQLATREPRADRGQRGDLASRRAPSAAVDQVSFVAVGGRRRSATSSQPGRRGGWASRWRAPAQQGSRRAAPGRDASTRQPPYFERRHQRTGHPGAAMQALGAHAGAMRSTSGGCCARSPAGAATGHQQQPAQRHAAGRQHQALPQRLAVAAGAPAHQPQPGQRAQHGACQRQQGEARHEARRQLARCWPPAWPARRSAWRVEHPDVTARRVKKNIENQSMAAVRCALERGQRKGGQHRQPGRPSISARSEPPWQQLASARQHTPAAPPGAGARCRASATASTAPAARRATGTTAIARDGEQVSTPTAAARQCQAPSQAPGRGQQRGPATQGTRRAPSRVAGPPADSSAPPRPIARAIAIAGAPLPASSGSASSTASNARARPERRRRQRP
jgi:two-component system phosphate regulon sensor histidine kinase PhoR